MRSEKVIKSSIWQFIYQVTIMLLGFFIPRYIILIYGSEINGLQSTIVQMLNILALMNAGAITASVYELYKPFALNEKDQIASILSNAVKYFLYVGVFFFVIMGVLAFIVSNTLHYSLKKYEIIIAFFILGIKSTIDIMFTSKYRIVFAADQRQHLTSIGMLIEQVVYYLLLFAVLVSKQYFLLMYACLLMGCVVKQIFYGYCFKKSYSGIRIDYRAKYKRPASANYAMINEISHTVVTGTISIIISYTHGLECVSIYSVYAIINTALIVFSNVFLNSFSPSFGNMIASGDKTGASRIFRSFHCMFSYMNTILYSCSAFLIMSFVKLYTAGTSDVDYYQPVLGVLICIYGLVNTYRIPFNILVSTNGLFKETWKQPLISAFLSIIVSVLFGRLNFAFVLIGPILFYLTNFIYQYCFMKTNLVEEGIDCVIRENLISSGIVSISLFAGRMLSVSFNSLFIWVAVAFVMFAFFTLVVTLTFIIYDKRNFGMASRYMKQVFISSIRRR